MKFFILSATQKWQITTNLVVKYSVHIAPIFDSNNSDYVNVIQIALMCKCKKFGYGIYCDLIVTI